MKTYDINQYNGDMTIHKHKGMITTIHNVPVYTVDDQYFLSIEDVNDYVHFELNGVVGKLIDHTSN